MQYVFVILWNIYHFTPVVHFLPNRIPSHHPVSHMQVCILASHMLLHNQRRSGDLQIDFQRQLLPQVIWFKTERKRLVFP